MRQARLDRRAAPDSSAERQKSSISSSIYQPGLLTDQKKPEDIIGENGLLEELTKATLERALPAMYQRVTWATRSERAFHFSG